MAPGAMGGPPGEVLLAFLIAFIVAVVYLVVILVMFIGSIVAWLSDSPRQRSWWRGCAGCFESFLFAVIGGAISGLLIAGTENPNAFYALPVGIVLGVVVGSLIAAIDCRGGYPLGTIGGIILGDSVRHCIAVHTNHRSQRTPSARFGRCHRFAIRRWCHCVCDVLEATPAHRKLSL